MRAPFFVLTAYETQGPNSRDGEADTLPPLAHAAGSSRSMPEWSLRTAAHFNRRRGLLVPRGPDRLGSRADGPVLGTHRDVSLLGTRGGPGDQRSLQPAALHRSAV